MYLAVYGMFVLLGISIQRRLDQMVAMAVCFLFLLIFMGWRYYVGCDYAGYLYRYVHTPPHEPLSAAFLNPEPGFELIMRFVVTSGLGYEWLNIICSLIILVCYWIFLRSHERPLLMLALMFPVLLMQLSMSGLRQAIAVGILMVATVQFMKRRRLATALIILLASQFHASAVMFLPLAALAKTKISFGRLTYAAFLLVPFALFLLADRLETYQDRYIYEIYGDQSAGGAVLRYLLLLPPAVLFFTKLKEMEAAYPRSFELLKIFNLAIIAVAPLTILSSFALHRIIFYLMPFSIVTFVYVVRFVFKERDAPIALVIPPALYGIYAVGWQLFSSHFRNCYAPYQNLLF